MNRGKATIAAQKAQPMLSGAVWDEQVRGTDAWERREALRAKSAPAAAEASRATQAVRTPAARRIAAVEVTLRDRQGKRLVDEPRRTALATAMRMGEWPEGIEATDSWFRPVKVGGVDFGD